jgi:hypothetical protein
MHGATLMQIPGDVRSAIDRTGLGLTWNQALVATGKIA